MAKKKTRPEEFKFKRRTRNHILEDLSIHHVSGFALRCGFTVERVENDYGFDLWMRTFAPNGEVETEGIWIQLKAAESLQQYELRAENCFSYPIRLKDIRHWMGSILPVYLILYDGQWNEAYWINIKEAIGPSQISGKYKNLRLPCANVLGIQTIQLMREHKNVVVTQHHALSEIK